MLVFEYVSIRKAQRRFDMVPAAEYVVDSMVERRPGARPGVDQRAVEVEEDGLEPGHGQIVSG